MNMTAIHEQRAMNLWYRRAGICASHSQYHGTIKKTPVETGVVS
jgi:hypothetical protein